MVEALKKTIKVIVKKKKKKACCFRKASFLDLEISGGTGSMEMATVQNRSCGQSLGEQR